MALKKRKTPLHALFGEREALRNQPIKTNIMADKNLIPISAVALDKIVLIENHSYQFKGQHTVKKQGIKKSVYRFKGVSTSVDKDFAVTKAPTFRLVNDILKMN